MSEALVKAEEELTNAITAINRCVEKVQSFDDASSTLQTLASQNQQMLEGLREAAEHVLEGAKLLAAEGVVDLKRRVKTLQVIVISFGLANLGLLGFLLYKVLRS